MLRSPWLRNAFALAVLVAASPASADTPAVQKGTGTGIDAATKGATDVTDEKFQAVDRSAAAAKDATELSLSLGALTATGNSRTQAATGSTKFRLRRHEDQVKLAAAANYARSAVAGSDYVTTVRNLQALERYDRFLGDVAIFGAAQQRNDEFQGLDLRLQLDPGVGYYFSNTKERLLWSELGYDFLYDVRRDDARAQTDGTLLDKTRTLHSGRLFLGYEQAVGDSSKLTSGVELLQGISDGEVRRLNFDVGLTAKIAGAFSIGVTISDRFDTKPLPGKEKNDLTTAASLVYTVL